MPNTFSLVSCEVSASGSCSAWQKYCNVPRPLYRHCKFDDAALTWVSACILKGYELFNQDFSKCGAESNFIVILYELLLKENLVKISFICFVHNQRFSKVPSYFWNVYLKVSFMFNTWNSFSNSEKFRRRIFWGF